MDFEDTAEEATFRAEVRKWLDVNASAMPAGAGVSAAERSDKKFLAASKAWQAKKAAAGYARITWPKEVGGYGGTPIQQVIFNQEEGRTGEVSALNAPFAIGLGMCIPTLMAYGGKDAIAR
ncbi:MAG: acyl-CoA dehydrogenase family protein, partial [Pseudomonadota bacterium]|nr:acyl-CoA dehydrogenase family protein [Pseudomonadota bacterium]